MINLRALFEKHDEESHKFERVCPLEHLRPDIHAFLLLDKLVPGNQGIVAGAEHDQIYLGVDLDELEEVISEEEVIDLIRCGVFLEDDHLCMFV